MSKGTKTLVIIVCILVGLAILLTLTAVIMTQIGKNAMTDDGSGMDVTTTGAQNEGDTIRYKGKLYRYNTKVSSILLMGIDDFSKDGYYHYGNSNQADVNVLAVLDPVNEKLSFISVSRDTICRFEVFDEEGVSQGMANGQLALAYSFGNDPAQGCEITTDAVSRLFYDLKIPAYGSIYMNGIIDLVDTVGGITITDDNGQQRSLNGYQTQNYIQYREHTVDGNNERMDRQSKVMKALVAKLLEYAKQDPSSVLGIYNDVKDDVETNISPSMIVYLAQQAAKLSFDGSIDKVPGQSVLNEDSGFAEFIIDDDAFFELLLDTFYIPVEE